MPFCADTAPVIDRLLVSVNAKLPAGADTPNAPRVVMVFAEVTPRLTEPTDEPVSVPAITVPPVSAIPPV